MDSTLAEILFVAAVVLLPLTVAAGLLLGIASAAFTRKPGARSAKPAPHLSAPAEEQHA